jgi:hypothetical protein
MCKKELEDDLLSAYPMFNQRGRYAPLLPPMLSLTQGKGN